MRPQLPGTLFAAETLLFLASWAHCAQPLSAGLPVSFGPRSSRAATSPLLVPTLFTVLTSSLAVGTRHSHLFPLPPPTRILGSPVHTRSAQHLVNHE